MTVFAYLPERYPRQGGAAIRFLLGADVTVLVDIAFREAAVCLLETTDTRHVDGEATRRTSSPQCADHRRETRAIEQRYNPYGTS